MLPLGESEACVGWGFDPKISPFLGGQERSVSFDSQMYLPGGILICQTV